MVASVLIGGSIGMAARAHADPASDAYAEKYAGAVCATLDDYPTYAGIQGVVIGIHNDGLSWYQSGEVLGTAVFNVCPRHADLVKSWANTVTSGISPVYSAAHVGGAVGA
jgi:hypothetical protein